MTLTIARPQMVRPRREYQVRLPSLHAGQLEIERSTARYKVVAAGRRWGKTRRSVRRVIAAGIQEPGGYFWAAPTYALTLEGWEQMQALASQIPGARVKRGERKVILPGGGWVQAKSANNPNSLRSRGLSGVVLEEAAFMEETAWTLALRPALVDKRGWAEFISTPNGHNWFYELAERAKTREQWSFFHAPTSTNPFISPEELEEIREELGPFAYAQEIEAEFAAEGTHAFRPQDFRYFEETDQGYVLEREPGVKELVPLDSVWSVQAIDLAASTSQLADFFVCVTLAVTSSGDRLVLDVHRNRVAPLDQTPLIESLYFGATPRPTLVGVEDVFQQVAVVQDLVKRTGIPVRGVKPAPGPDGKKDKFTRSLGSAQMYANHKVFHRRGAKWLAEFERELWDFPLGRHDDQVDALVYAVQLSDVPGAGLLDYLRQQRAEREAEANPTQED